MYKAKKLPLNIVYGKEVEQFKYIYDYVVATFQFNLSSSVRISREEGRFFQRMYVKFDACKRGFLAKCRPFISVYGCHLKSRFKGQLLCAVGKDGNDDMFPLAMVVVEKEN